MSISEYQQKCVIQLLLAATHSYWTISTWYCKLETWLIDGQSCENKYNNIK